MNKFEMSFSWDDQESAYYQRLMGNTSCMFFKQGGILKTVKKDEETQEDYCQRTITFIKSKLNSFNGYLEVTTCKFS